MSTFGATTVQTVSRLLAVLVLAAGLSGCFTAQTPLIGDKAVFPYEKIVWMEEKGTEEVTMTHEGNAYRFRPKEAKSDGFLRLMPVGDLTLAELEFSEAEKVNRLYAVLKVDMEAKTVQSFAAVAPDGFDEEGFTPCDDGMCVDSLDAYIAYARRLIDDGRPPDGVYRIIATE